jgi:hypothetical protein
MLQFKLNDVSAELIVTLTENVSLTNPYFLFVFTHVLTKDIVAFVAGPDESLSPNRYNKFTVNPSVLFASKQPGEWHYVVYEQLSSNNINPLASGAALEYGKLMIDRTAEFSFNTYESATTFKTYNG